MPIINRDGDNSEKKEWVNFSSGFATGISYGLGVGTGVTMIIGGPIPYPYVVQTVYAYAMGVSGAPQLAFGILRPLPGAVGASFPGSTVILIGVSNLVLSSGTTSLAQGFSGLAAQGSTLLTGQAGDCLLATTAGANSACTQLVINVVVKKTQDIVSHNNIQS